MQTLSVQIGTAAILPLTALVCFIFLFSYLGVSFLAGMAVFIVGIFTNVNLARLLARFQK